MWRALARRGLPAARSLASAAGQQAQGAPPLAPREWLSGSRRTGLLGRKSGMLSVWDKWGRMLPVTVVEVQDNVVVQAKTVAKEGYDGVQVGAGWQKRKRVQAGYWGQFEARGLECKRDLSEFRVSADALLPVGTRLLARHFVPGQYVDVQGTTKGKGFQGVMKRHGFKGGNASHGATKVHRAPGSLGGGTNSHTGGKVVKGKKMPGNMGNASCTQQRLQVYRVDPERNLVYVLGSLPGAAGSVVRLTDSKKQVVPHGLPLPPFPTFAPREGEPEVRLRAPPARPPPRRMELAARMCLTRGPRRRSRAARRLAAPARRPGRRALRVAAARVRSTPRCSRWTWAAPTRSTLRSNDDGADG